MSNDESQLWVTVAGLAASPLNRPVAPQIRAALAQGSSPTPSSGTTRGVSAVQIPGSASRPPWARYRLSAEGAV